MSLPPNGHGPLRDQQQADEILVAELARLSAFEYERKRRDSSKALGITVATLDKAVAKQRGRASAEDADPPHWKVERWPKAVAGEKLLNDLTAAFTRYVILPEYAAEALALWVVHTWAFDAWDISPFMVLVSPERRCGKTSVLIILQFLTPRSELAGNISAAATFRYIEDQRPTLLMDEAETYIKDNEQMRGVLNSGHTKTTAYVIRLVEVCGEYKAKRFSTWAPKAIASIGSLADTLEDRSIIVRMKRKKSGTIHIGGKATMTISRCCADECCVGARTTSRSCRRQIQRSLIFSTIAQRTTGVLCWP
jgi:putative DNA primase/helicase